MALSFLISLCFELNRSMTKMTVGVGDGGSECSNSCICKLLSKEGAVGVGANAGKDLARSIGGRLGEIIHP